jgi:phosphate transport system protein
MSKHLEIEIEKLNKRILTVGESVVEAIQKALQALQERRAELAQEVMEGDHKIDRAEVEVEEECLRLLALYQPVAEDLRFIAAVMKIDNDMERMGDEASNIAGHALFLASRDPLPIPPRLLDLWQVSLRMVRESLSAFVNADADAARRICAEDDEADKYDKEVITSLWRMIESDPHMVERAARLFSVSRALERIADHATNIAEDVVYMVEGKIIRHRAGLPPATPESS